MENVMQRCPTATPINEGTEKRPRLAYVDVAKILGMVCVIFAHCLGHGNWLDALLYSFHLPLFFILNGITLRVHEGEEFGAYLHRKIKSYVFPMFCLCALAVFSEMWVRDMQGLPQIDKYFGNVMIGLLGQKRVYSLWFVGALFFADVFFFYVIKWSKNKLRWALPISLAFLWLAIYCNKNFNYSYTWNIDVALFGVFFVFIGYAFSHQTLNKIKTFLLKKRWISLLFGCAFLALGLFIAYYNFKAHNLYLEMWARKYQKYYLVIPAAVLSGIGVVLISNAISNKLLALLGQTTFVLLAFHQIFCMPLFTKVLFPDWYAVVRTYAWKTPQYLGCCAAETAFSVLLLVAVHFIIVYSPFAFILNKKMPQFYKTFFKKIKSAVLKLVFRFKKIEMVSQTIEDQEENQNEYQETAFGDGEVALLTDTPTDENEQLQIPFFEE